jgi:hypothetical protein
VERLAQSLKVLAWAWRGVAAMSLRPVIWFPFLVAGGIQALALWFLVSFHHPALLPLGLPVIKALAGDAATHYPVLYFALPSIFYRVNLGISVLVASITGGVATILFARAFGWTGGRGAWGHAFRRAPLLIVISFLVVALWYGVSRLGALIPQDLQQSSSAVRWGTRGALMFLAVLVQSFLVYSTAWILLMGHRLWPAVRDSIRVASRTLLPTLLAVGVPTLLLFPFSYASGRADIIVNRFKPEMVSDLLGAMIVGEVLVTFFLVGTITRLFVWRLEAQR